MIKYMRSCPHLFVALEKKKKTLIKREKAEVMVTWSGKALIYGRSSGPKHRLWMACT